MKLIYPWPPRPPFHPSGRRSGWKGGVTCIGICWDCCEDGQHGHKEEEYHLGSTGKKKQDRQHKHYCDISLSGQKEYKNNNHLKDQSRRPDKTGVK